MVKPDGVQRGLVGEIIQRFERRGYKLVAIKMMHASEQLLQIHYEALKSLPFFPKLVAYMSSGPVVPMVFEGRKVSKNSRRYLLQKRYISHLPRCLQFANDPDFRVFPKVIGIRRLFQ